MWWHTWLSVEAGGAARESDGSHSTGPYRHLSAGSGSVLYGCIMLIRLLLACCVLLVSCTANSGNAACEADLVVSNPSITGEAQLRTTSVDFEAWSLWFTDLAAGDPIAIPTNEEVKVVWSVTGDGDFSVATVHADGTTMEPTFGPARHDGSNWEAPGDEWGTGWIFPKAGCWDMTVTRGTDTAYQTIVVEG